MPEPRYRVIVAGRIGKAVVEWLYELIPLLRRAPKNVKVTVELRDTEDNDPSGADPRGRTD